MDEITVYLLSALGTFFLAVYVHEFGHFTAGHIIGFNPKIHYDKFHVPYKVTQYYFNYNKKYLKLTGISGILAGFMPLYIYSTLFDGFVPFAVLLLIVIVYIAACGSDIDNLIKNKPVQVKLSNYSE